MLSFKTTGMNVTEGEEKNMRPGHSGTPSGVPLRAGASIPREPPAPHQQEEARGTNRRTAPDHTRQEAPLTLRREEPPSSQNGTPRRKESQGTGTLRSKGIQAWDPPGSRAFSKGVPRGRPSASRSPSKRKSGICSTSVIPPAPCARLVGTCRGPRGRTRARPTSSGVATLRMDKVPGKHASISKNENERTARSCRREKDGSTQTSRSTRYLRRTAQTSGRIETGGRGFEHRGDGRAPL